jgi:hypothetical protein
LGKSILAISKENERKKRGDSGASYEVHIEVEGARSQKG